jgi:hypothetical protein
MWLSQRSEPLYFTNRNLGETITQELTLWPNRRVNAIFIEYYSQITLAGVPVYNQDGLRNLVKNVSITLNTARRKQHTPVDVRGPAVQTLIRNQGGWSDRQQLQYWDYAPNAAGNYFAYNTYLVPLRCLQFADPYGSLTSVPCNILQSKPILKIQLASAAEIATNYGLQAGTSITVVVTVLYSDESGDPKSGQFLPRDTITHPDSRWADNRYLIPPEGLITNLMLETFDGANPAPDTAFNLSGSQDRFQLRRGTDVLFDESRILGSSSTTTPPSRKSRPPRTRPAWSFTTRSATCSAAMPRRCLAASTRTRP